MKIYIKSGQEILRIVSDLETVYIYTVTLFEWLLLKAPPPPPPTPSPTKSELSHLRVHFGGFILNVNSKLVKLPQLQFEILPTLPPSPTMNWNVQNFISSSLYSGMKEWLS